MCTFLQWSNQFYDTQRFFFLFDYIIMIAKPFVVRMRTNMLAQR